MPTLLFFGSDQYSATVLNAFIKAQYSGQITVITDRGKPKEKAGVAQPTEVEKLAKTHNLKVFYYPSIPEKLNTNTVGLCASFNHLIPKGIIDQFGGNLYNLHPSLLPQYRNVAPVPYAIAMGDAVTGITLHRISEGIDNGEIVGQVSEPIHGSDTAPVLLHRLFAMGAELFLSYEPCNPANHYKVRNFALTKPLIFTRRLTSAHGYLEWSVLQKLLAGSSVAPSDTANPLLQLRLAHNPQGTILHDLVRALTGWEKVWTLAPTKKGELRVTLISPRHGGVIPDVLIAGKPNAISWSDFTTYYSTH